MPYDVTQFETMKDMVINDLFVKTADQTYVVARWCFINRLNLNFYWNGVHAVEKYLKASLLFNGRKALNYGHDIERLFKEVLTFANESLPEQLECPKPWPSDIWRDETTSHFVSRLNELGDPNNRYNLFGFTQFPDDLQKLDQLVFAVRSIAQALDRHATHTSKLTISGTTCEVQQAALTYNFSFAPDDHRHKSLQTSWSASEALLYSLIISPTETAGLPNSDTMLARAKLADWVIGNIQMPKENMQQIRDAAAKLRCCRA